MYYTQLSINCINFGSAHFRNTRPAATITAPCRAVRPYKDLQWNANISHHRRIRRCVLHSTAVCFAVSLRGNCFRWERCLHAGGAVVQICRKNIVCWPQRSSTDSFCGLRYNPIRIQRLFLPTFSGKTEKVGRRRHSRGVTANSVLRCQPEKGTDFRPPLQGILQSCAYSVSASLCTAAVPHSARHFAAKAAACSALRPV